MKSGLCTLVLLTVLSLSAWAYPADTLDAGTEKMLRSRLAEYLDALKTEPAAVQNMEVDFIINSCTDSVIRQKTALIIFDYFLNSRIMGAESVAVHLCDNWFIPGKIQMRSPDELLAARIFAEFNRSSLIGMPAPELALEDTTGSATVLFPAHPERGHGRTDGRFSILYFYDTDCAKCKMESIMLRNILDNDDFPADFYAIYTGSDKEGWLRYIDSSLTLSATKTRTIHLWDPDFTSGLQMKYGVLETPRLFLVAPDGTIAGRGLDSMALEQLLKALLAPKELEYGSKESEAFYEGIFSRDSIGCEDVKEAAGHIAARTLEEAHDTLLFKQMAGDLLYYLSGKREQAFKCGTEYLVRNLILGRDDIWDTADDTLKIVQFAEISEELLGRAAIGSKVPDIRLHATLKTAGKTRQGEFRLGRLHRETVIIFHTEGCAICKAELAAADSLLAKMDKRQRNTAVLLVDMDEILVSYPAIAEQLFNTFDLTSLPYIIRIDRKGTVIGKYISLI